MYAMLTHIHHANSSNMSAHITDTVSGTSESVAIGGGDWCAFPSLCKTNLIYNGSGQEGVTMMTVLLKFPLSISMIVGH